ncbi:MAG TPA: hypothetical protein VK886_08855 [Vicinamibacterales bacterium]|nr:hypothetical protein [Vicinamibacterales bacterium]
MRDKLARARTKTRDAADATARDLRNRSEGLLARMSQGDGSVPDRVLEARVRAMLGRVVSHPRAIRVAASNGTVRVEGPILATETSRALSAIESVKGVRSVEKDLTEHETPGDIPALQGGSSRVGTQWELMQSQWSPSTRLLVTAAAIGVAAVGVGLLSRA